ncbi:MAG: hypothetical protein ACI8UO_002705 [Verrucomicrobiales bacterium]|jgi:hypothetical protein
MNLLGAPIAEPELGRPPDKVGQEIGARTWPGISKENASGTRKILNRRPGAAQ